MPSLKRLLLVFVFALVPVALAAPSAVAKPRLGIDPAVYPSAYPDLFRQDLEAFGAGKKNKPMVRYVMLWADIAPTEPAEPRNPNDPAYQWGAFDVKMQAAYAAGVRDFIAVAFTTPPWASALKSQPAGRKANLPDIEAYTDFLTAAQTRFSGLNGTPRIRNWEIWNEPNIGTNLQAPKRSVLIGHYSKMLRASRTELRATAQRLGIPMPTVIAGAIGGVTGVKHDAFVRGIAATPQCKGAANSRQCFDAISIHPYSQNPRVDPLGKRQRVGIVSVGNFPSFVKVVNDAWPGRRTPIWVTEIAWQTDPPDKFMGVSYRKQATYMRQAYQAFAKFPQVKAMIWYGWVDEPQDATRRFGGWQSGIRTEGGAKKKPAWSEFRKLM